MPIEIEHKYLINKKLWKQAISESNVEIRQAYLLTNPDKTIRIRTIGNKGYITIKGKSIGATRREYEYEIPLRDANELIKNYSSNLVAKTRHYINHDGKLWEVDEFKGLNIGLIVAEIELKSENEKYSLPSWVEKNVTDDHRYSNSNLSIKPYSIW